MPTSKSFGQAFARHKALVAGKREREHDIASDLFTRVMESSDYEKTQ
jgi:hypothetical protein